MIFFDPGSQNRLPEGWGGAAQLWVGKKLFSSNQSKITQKEISDQAHPHHKKKSHLEIGNFGVFQTQNRVCLSEEPENHLSDGSEISGILGGPSNIPILLTMNPGAV